MVGLVEGEGTVKVVISSSDKVSGGSLIPIQLYTHMSIKVCVHAQKQMVDDVLIAITYYLLPINKCSM